jgi:hypothetical protein
VRAAGRIGGPVVTKPLAGNHGRGVSIKLATDEEVEAGFAKAAEYSRNVVVEKYLEGFDHRLLVINGELIAAAKRIPGHVVGDGRRTVTELVEVLNQDAMQFLLQTAPGTYDVILADLPDPNNVSLARLYSREFFNLVASRLKPAGVFVTQSTSPYFARQAFWTIHETLQSSDFDTVVPYHVNVPSFGIWGFNLATRSQGQLAHLPRLSVATRYLDEAIFSQLFIFPPDLRPPDEAPAVSTLDDPKLMHAYLKGWNYWR